MWNSLWWLRSCCVLFFYCKIFYQTFQQEKIMRWNVHFISVANIEPNYPGRFISRLWGQAKIMGFFPQNNGLFLLFLCHFYLWLFPKKYQYIQPWHTMITILSEWSILGKTRLNRNNKISVILLFSVLRIVVWINLWQGCHIWVGSKFPDISLTIPWHIIIFPWQFILFFQVKNKDCPLKTIKYSYIYIKCFCQKAIM